MMSKSWILVVNSFAGGPFLGTIGMYACKVAAYPLKSCHYRLCFQGCSTFATLGTMSGLVQIWTIMVISVERAHVILHPLATDRHLSNTQVGNVAQKSQSFMAL